MRSFKKSLRIIVRKGPVRFSANAIEAINRLDKRKQFNRRKPTVSKKDNVIIMRRKKLSTIGDALFNKIERKGVRGMNTFKTSKPNRNALLTNTKRKKKNSKFIFTKHMVKRNVKFIIGVFYTKFKNKEEKIDGNT